MFRLDFIVILLYYGFLFQISKCQSVKGGSRSVKTSSHSQYQRRTYSSHDQMDEPAQRQYHSQSAAAPQTSCDRPSPPMNGRLSCQMSNNKYTCTGSCIPGYKFPDDKDTMQLECSQLSGVWLPYRNFPDCVGSHGGGYDSSHQREYRREYSHSSSSSQSGSYGHGQSQQMRQNLCGSPKTLMNGRHYCSMANGQWSCQGTCNPGYDFPDGSLQMTLSCHDRDGVWSPSNEFPDCILLCHPECENGGQCAVHNQCLCPSTYRGNRCQYSVTLCDFNRISSGSLYSDCAHSADYTECRISCPPGMIFQPPTTSVYRCTVDGHWNPPRAPECVSDSLCERPPPPKNGRIECQGSSEIMLCRGTCITGYLFPDAFNELSIQCVKRTGEWSPDVGFPDCEPICNPPCENGGKCLGHNSCLCPRGYRGGRCQYATANCDGHDRFASVAWSCKHGERETQCEISCGPTGSTLQPPEPKVYTCSLDGTWHPDLKPICVTDHSITGQRSSHSERYEVRSSSHEQTSGHSRSSMQHGSRSSHEFGGQQAVDYDFEGQQQMEHDFGGQQQMGHNYGEQQQAGQGFGGQQQQMGHNYGGQQRMGHDFGGQQPVDYDFGGQQQIEHEFGGQRPVDYEFDNGQLNGGGGGIGFGQRPVDYEDEIQSQVSQQQQSFIKSPDTRQKQGKEAPDAEFMKGGYREREDEDGGNPEEVEPETEGSNTDVFSHIDRVSSFHGICSVWGYHHYRSFDGGVFTFPSYCPYVLASNCGHDDLVISVLTECDTHAPCERTVEIQLQENTYLVSYQRGLIENGMNIPIPTHVGDLTVERIARYLVARLTIGFTIWINEENTVLIVANQFMKNKTCGMCGNFDGYLDEKFISQDGTKTTDIYSFANSWKRDEDGICVDNVEHDLPCSSDTREKRLASDGANLLCASLYNAEFHSCSQLVDPEVYYAKCQMDCCSLMSEDDCECASIGEFVLECSRNGFDMKDGWRKPGLCPMKCRNGTEYNECGPSCPPTCDDQEPTCQQERCVDGCHCPEGTVLENGHCITIDQCPCHHGEKIYASGETMEQDCNTCVCQGGNWQCTDSTCPATCSVSGPHFQTFDGLLYDFSGECAHYLVDADGFNVQIDYSNNCRDMPSLTSVCIRSITIHTSEGAVVKLKQTMEVSVNGREMLSLPVLAPGVYVGQATSKYIRAQLNNGLEILWDMDASIQVYAPVSLYGDLKGLCGTFTRNQQDDFLTPEGDVEMSSGIFAEKWKVEENCVDYASGTEQDKPCDRFPERRPFAVRVCRVISQEDEFKECHSLVDYQRYYEECMEDICGCMHEPASCACLSLSNYAMQCARKGRPLAWRQSMPVCGVPCPMGQIYQPCADPCTYTCGEIAHSYSNCREVCVEGCVCPPGQTLDFHGKCVAVSSCSCVHSGHVYPPEFMQRRGREMCECSQGQWACHEASPSDFLLTPPPHVASDCDASANLEATDCVSECPLTCANLHHHQPCTTATCVPGCRCKKGYIMDATTGKCVKPVDCPCHHSGKSYEEGEQVIMDCHTCTCESGTWQCDTKPCPGLCSAWGDSHYETFDGRLFDYEGSCDYVMVKAHVSESTIFSVVIQNIPCSGNGGATCGKSLSITLGDQTITLTRDHPLPEVPENSPLTVSSVGMFTLVDNDIGISVQWDRNSRVYVIAQPIWESKLQGLCGDFNSDSSDDFRSPSGGIPLVLAKDFADSWRVHKYCKPASQPRNACDKNPERRTWSRHKCSVLKSELFKPCHYQVEVEEYFKRCVQDSCACNSGGDCECLCAVVSAYAQKCARRGVVIPWRSQDLCPVQCESCDRYSPCISLCPAPNCDTYLEDEEEGHSCFRQPCVDGCEPKPCERGQVHKSATNLTCIPEQFCTEKPCTVIDGVPYREGERIPSKDVGDACQSCYCRRGEMECIGMPCVSTTTKPTIGFKLEACEYTGWTDWINSMDPSDYGGDDREDLEDLVVSRRIPCPLSNITSIQCRIAETQEPIESGEQDVICGLENNGMMCKNSFRNGFCEDYEMRVFCQCHEEVTCPPDQEWNTCAFSCDSLCHSMEAFMDEEGACGHNEACVPGCTREACKFPKFARDAETCVSPDMCTCKLSSGHILAPGQVKTDGCQKCQCLNNSLICSTLLECKEILPPPEFTEETWKKGKHYRRTSHPKTKGKKVTHSNEEPQPTANVYQTVPPAYQTPPPAYLTVPTIYQTLPPGYRTLPPGYRTSAPGYRTLRPSNRTIPPRYRTVSPGYPTLPPGYPTISPGQTLPPGYQTIVPGQTLPPGYRTISPGQILPPGYRTISPGQTLPPGYRTISPVQTLPPGYRTISPGQTLPPGYRTISPGQTLPPGYRTIAPGQTLPPGYRTIAPGQTLPPGYRTIAPGQTLPPGYRTIVPGQTLPPGYRTIVPGQTLPPGYETLPPVYQIPEEVECSNGWSGWQSLHLPDRRGEKESLEDMALEDLLGCSLDQVTKVQCREVKTARLLKYSGQDNIYCDLRHGGLECNNRNTLGRRKCQDYEIRAYCDCEELPGNLEMVTAPSVSELPPYGITVMPTFRPRIGGIEPAVGIISTTPSCSYWSNWINKRKPRRGKKHGDKEDTKAYVLRQTEGFCLEGHVSDIECQEASTGKDYTETNEEHLICDVNKGFLCQNKHQPDGRCEDYKIRYFCTCGEETEVPLLIRTTPSAYIYPCSELILLIDGPNPLPDSKIKASSSASSRSGPDALKMKSKGRRKAWTAALSNTNQFVEVDLTDVRAIYGIITKGKEDSDEWITSYQLLYSKDGVSYSYYQDENDNNMVFSGNYDDTMEVKHVFSQPFEARYVRLEPLSWEKRITLKWDLLGCAEAITTTPVSATEFHIPFGIKTVTEEECKEPMGLENKYTGKLSASSFYDPETSPENGRMGSDTAWVAGSSNVNQYLEVDFLDEETLTGLITRGREDAPQWVLSYMVAYGNDGENWEKVTDEDDKPMIFDANDDQDTKVTNMFPSSIKARFIRIIPLSWKGKISMQVEILGCLKPSEEEEVPEIPVPDKTCRKPMGLENGLLMDSQLSASSSYSPKFTPDNARIGSPSVWAAAVQDDNQYLQIDFVDPQKIAGIITKGREDLPQWVTAFTVDFSKDGEVWNKVKDSNGEDKEFPANYDQFSTVQNLFPSTIRTRLLRIRPTKWKNWISMQIEILGCYHPEPCRDPMGIENSIINDHQLTASSEMSNLHSADNARLYSSKAWSPEISDKNPYLQVDLLEPSNLTAVVTKGNPEIQQWVKSFYVAYSNDSLNWKKVENVRGRAKEFPGNKDQDSPVINLFPIAVMARYVRIIPLEWHRWVSLRLELLGCFHEQVCRIPMGLEDGIISKAQITASSSSDTETTPSHARLNDKSGWQPESYDKHPYLQIDFLADQNVSGVVTKGMSDVDNWVTEFKVVFSEDARKWYPIITDMGDDVVFNANEDKDTPVFNNFPEIVEARYFRIVPLDFHNAIGLRVEFLGCYHPKECMEPMGMESGSVFDFQVQASSFLDDEFSPANARLDSDTAWVADVDDDDPYIQVDFMVRTVLTGLMTRGRNDANEWVKEYRIEHSTDGSDFVPELDEYGMEKVYEANYDSESPVTNTFSEPINTRVLRIVPTKFERKVSMRFEVLGCFHKAGCMEPMGIENGLLDDSHITASSYRSDSTNPTKARLSSEKSWMPEEDEIEPYLQIDFTEERNISAVVTMGDATQNQWVTAYQVAYSDDSYTWSTVDDPSGEPIIFPGNQDNDKPAINVLPQTLEARFIRIIPTDWRDDIALRTEILGCYHPYEEISPELTTTVVVPERVLPMTGIPTEIPMVVQCPDPMEPEVSLMPGARITASSSTPTGGPSRVLIKTPANAGLSGGWVPSVDDLHPVLQIELKEKSWLTSIYIQGREDEENWVKTLRVVASPNNRTWMPVFGLDGDEVIEGNENQRKIVARFFLDPTEAKYVKIIPETWHKWPSFRMDLRGCRILEVSTVLPEYPDLCPELLNHPELAEDCPERCPTGQLCDGDRCVDPVDCICVHDGTIFKVGDRLEDRSCQQCDCALGGHSICKEQQCEPCEEDKIAVLNDDCICTCEECGDDKVLCPTSLECIYQEQWCDGVVDCPDDETSCIVTEPSLPRRGTFKPEAKIKPVKQPIVPAIPLPTEEAGIPENAACNIMGTHIETFDGQDIIYDVCNHVAMKDLKSEKYNVTVHKECGYVSECKHWIEVNYLKQHIKVRSDLNVELNGHSYTTAQLWRLSKKTRMSLVVKKVGEQVIIKALMDNFTIIYDIRGRLEIEVAPELQEKIGGLCGYYSGKVEDDQRKPNGRRAFTSKEFGESWLIHSKGKECKPLICPHEQMAKAMELCHKLKEDPFIPCIKLLPLSQFIEFCMSTTCECLLDKSTSENKCKCDGMLPLVEACEAKLGNLAVRNWRLIHECHTECPPGMEWNDCGPSCQLTCDSTSSDTLECSDRCVPGCFCPPGTVLNDEECIPPDQCRDQVCQGFGDPHFKTFDGLFFPFQAVGSFLIVSDTEKNFEVKGLSKKCGLFNPITCLVGMEIIYDRHKISIKKDKELKVDEKKISMEELPLHKDGMVILGYPGRTFVVVIPKINIEARYYEENSGFAVRIPSRRYFNKTRGLCGNCNGRDDDELKNEPLNDYVCSWQTEGEKEDCIEDLETLPELVERVPICKKLEDPVFEACHPLLDVDIYVDACNFDATHSGDDKASFCKTAMEYGRQCCQLGIIIEDWPGALGCDIECPSGMEYEQCHRGCPQTCLSKKNESGDSSCKQLKTDGCFCPEGKVLKDDACEDIESCETCDEQGHMPGDKWNDGPCKHCQCREDLNVECVLEVCPSPPICSSDETLSKREIELEIVSCCESYVCVPKEEDCPTMKVPKCKTGEVAKIHKGYDSCPYLKCECDPLLCAPLAWPDDLEDGQQSVTANDSCCPVVQIVCFDELCPDKPDCNEDLELVENPGECCTNYKCKPPKDVCVYTHMYKVIEGFQSLIEQIETDTSIYQPGEEWEDGLCEKCSCVESNGQYAPHCIMEHCSTLEDMPDNKDYVLQEMKVPDKCCPDIFKIACRDEDGNVYGPGEEWKDDDDPCVTYLCEEHGTGDVIKTKSVINCTECPRTAVLFPPSKALGQCCGFCKPTKCEDGDDLYTIGEKWTSADDSCRVAECVSEYGKVHVVYTKQPCPTIPKDCPPEKIIPDEDGCCQVCNLTSEISCSTGPIAEADTIGFFTYNEPSEGGICINKRPVSQVLQCKGACHSRSYYSLEDGEFKDVCQCCKVNITIEREIELQCPSGNSIRKTFLQPESCQCSKCAPKSGDSKKNDFESQSPWVQQSQWDTDTDFVFAQSPSEKGRFTQQKSFEPSNDWQFEQNQVQQEEDYDSF